MSDTSAADEKRRRDEDARQQAIDRALAKLKVRFGGCFDLGPPGRGAAVLRFKLHRTGFVLAPSVSGVDSKVASCIGSALARLRVEGPQGETITVQRRIQFHTVQR